MLKRKKSFYILHDPLKHSGKEKLQRWRTVRGLQGTKMKVDFGSWRVRWVQIQKGSMRQLFCGDKTILCLECSGSYMNLYM